MKSDIYNITNETESLSAILKETEKVSKYAGLDKKQSGRLRLLAEELVCMLPELLSYNKAEFWIEAENKNIELHTSFTPDVTLTAERRQKLLSVSSSGKNTAAKGIMNKIRLAAEFLLLDYAEATAQMPMATTDFFEMGMVSSPVFADNYWSLETFRKQAEEKKGEHWDELEKSIIANIADDVLVGISGSKVDIIVKKAF